MPQEMSPKKPTTQSNEFLDTSLHPAPTDKKAHTFSYHCTKCSFSHKSAVALHVHYQKKHPDEAITINKLKQSGLAATASQISPATAKPDTPKDVSESLVKVTENLTPRKSGCDLSTGRKDTSSQTRQRVLMSLMKLKGTLVACKRPGSSTSKELRLEDKREKETNNSEHELAEITNDSVPNSPVEIFSCQVCPYSSANVTNVVTHYNTEHTMLGLTTAEEVVWYNTKIQKKEPEAGALAHSNIEECQTNPTAISKNEEAFSLYDCPENLFYCQKCNFANVSLKGVINHQSVAHKVKTSRRECIIAYTVEIRDEIKKLKSLTKDSPLPSYLPPPLINLGDETKLFCHICNFRSISMSNVLRHYYSRHPNHLANTNQVIEYTASIIQQPPTKQKNYAVEKKQRKQVKKHKLFQQDLPSKLTAVEQAKTFECYRCKLKFQGLPNLRKHMWTDHHSNRPNIELLGLCFRKGLLEPGYYCNKCGFSHTRAEVVLEHFKKQHPKAAMTLQFVTTKLYIGRELLPNKSEKKRTKNVTVADDYKTANLGNLSPEAGKYSCRYCSFNGDSLSSITHHFCTVRPKTPENPVPNVSPSKESVTNLHIANDHQDTTELGFESYQVPIEFGSPSESSEEGMKNVKCLYCPAKFASQRGLNTHCGLLHQEIAVLTQIKVYVCSHCTYVNATSQGILTHCQMKHPDSESWCENVYLNEVHVRGWEGDGKPLRGYMCKQCPRIFVSQERMIRHSTFECSKRKGLQKVLSGKKVNLSSLSKASLLCRKKYEKYRCKHCNVTFNTKFALSNHLQIEHKEECLYQCALCAFSYSEKKKLGSHYSTSHGQEAFVKYFQTMYQQDTESAPNSSDRPSFQQLAEPYSLSAMADDCKPLVFMCPRCPYINTSCHGTLTHCQMKHPKLVVRADKLSTQHVLRSSMFKCQNVSRSTGQGYMCYICPLIFKSHLHLKKHHQNDHSSHQDNISNIADAQDLGQGCASKSNVVEEHLRNHPVALGAGPVKERHFKCRLCTYKGLQRQNLQHHYRKVHKLNTASAYKLMDKYNVRQRNFQDLGDEDGAFKCKLCPNIAFTLPLFLINHYSTFHKSNRETDFRIVSHMTDRNTGVYNCGHCKKRINGIKNLSLHLDRHRAWKMKTMPAVDRTSLPQATCSEVHSEKDSSVCEPVVPTNYITLQTSPTRRPPNQALLLPSDPLLLEPPELEPELIVFGDKHSCKHCQRTFMSLKGLRSHERSHAALAAIKKLDNASTLALNHSINEYLIHKPGTLRPFLCSICSFRTTAMSLLRCHFMKKHRDVILEASMALNRDKNEETANQDPDLSVEHDTEPETVEEVKVNKSVYMEPADVQRQLNYFSSMLQRSQASQSIHTNSCTLFCEFCNFTTGHLSSVRRHYLSRHGKKIYRCKDCDFITGLRKRFDLHLENVHRTTVSKAIRKKDLCCPFCLYESNNKNHMIDHIVLHREERVVPIEVRRSKLSRYLEGVVFQCHKCTFSCGTSDSLQVHVKKHHEVKPYRCRLCFFDSALLSQLEEHLSQKHQVLRNHELVGQVILDKPGHERLQEEEPALFDLKEDAVLTADIGYNPVVKKSRSADIHSENGTHHGAGSMFCKQTEHAAESNELHIKTFELDATDEGASHENCAMKADQDRTIKIEQICSEDDTSIVYNSDSQNMFNCLPPNSVRMQRRLRHDSDLGHEEDCQLNSEETADLYADMPVLENEFLKDTQVSIRSFKEENNGGKGKDGLINRKDEDQEERGLSTDASTASGIVPSATDDRWYVCTMCGRKLPSSWELKRHAMRHGI